MRNATRKLALTLLHTAARYLGADGTVLVPVLVPAAAIPTLRALTGQADAGVAAAQLLCDAHDSNQPVLSPEGASRTWDAFRATVN